MARKFLTPIDLAQNELQNARVQNLGSAPATPVKGQLYMNTSDNTLYWYDGAQWIAAKAAAGATPAATVTASAPSDASVVGVSTNFAREDHKHGREALRSVIAGNGLTGGGALSADVTIDVGAGTGISVVANAVAVNGAEVPYLAGTSQSFTGTGNAFTQPLTVATPVNPTDAANKQYVDNLSAGLSWKDSVRLASTAEVVSITGLAAIDGVTPVVGNRILLKNQSAPVENGIWVAASGAWTRATDADVGAEMVQATVFVEEGTTQADTAWTCTTNAPITLNVTGLTWAQFAGGGTVTAGAGMTQSGNTLNVIGDASITVAADAISRAALTGDVTAAAGANATTIANVAVTAAKIADGVVSNTKLAQMPSNTIKGNNDVPGAPVDLTTTQVATMFAGVLARKYAGAVAAATSTVINHAFNTRDVAVNVYRVASPYDTIECDVERTDVNNVTVRFATAPAAAEYRVVVLG